MIGEFADTRDVYIWLVKRRLIKNCMLCLWQCGVSTKRTKSQVEYRGITENDKRCTYLFWLRREGK